MDIKKLVKQMTLEEKASLCSGSDFWHTQPIERLGITAVMVSDGSHGLRKIGLPNPCGKLPETFPKQLEDNPPTSSIVARRTSPSTVKVCSSAIAIMKKRT